MLDCISVANMRESDRKTIENYVPSLKLMYRAAMGVFRASQWQGRIVIAVGSGNNGGDGYALAGILKRQGTDCCVVTLSDKRSADGAYYAEEAEHLGVSIKPYRAGDFADADIVVDCLLGTGFQGGVRDTYAAAISEMNTCGARIISVDINSGMNGDTGAADLAVSSDLTVTIGYVKNGMLAPGADSYMKHLVCTDIGIILDREENKICAKEEWREEYARRKDIFLCPSYLDMAVIDAKDV